MGCKPFGPQPEALGFEFLTHCRWLSQELSLEQDGVPASPTHFDVAILLFTQWVGVGQPHFRFFSPED